MNILTFKTFAFNIQPRNIPQYFDVFVYFNWKQNGHLIPQDLLSDLPLVWKNISDYQFHSHKTKLQFHETPIFIVVFVYDDRSRVLSLHNLCILRSRRTAWKLFCKSFKVIENIFCGSSGIQCKMLVSAARERNEMKWRKPNIH